MQAEPRVGCGVAIIVAGRILLLKRATEPESGCWGLPGGKIDLYETALAAAKREAQEELGIGVEPGELLCLVDQIDRAGGMHWVAPVYLAESHAGTPRIVEPDKHAGLDWFALDALPEPLTTSAVVAVAAWRARG